MTTSPHPQDRPPAGYRYLALLIDLEGPMMLGALHDTPHAAAVVCEQDAHTFFSQPQWSAQQRQAGLPWFAQPYPAPAGDNSPIAFFVAPEPSMPSYAIVAIHDQRHAATAVLMTQARRMLHVLDTQELDPGSAAQRDREELRQALQALS